MKRSGFTLAELLIALVILGLIATFTIPKVLTGQQDGKYKAVAKEAAATMSEAYTIYRQSNTPDASTFGGSLTPYLNYVKLVTNQTIDNVQGYGQRFCTAPSPCLLLHNGAIMEYKGAAFGNTNATNAFGFVIDPDGKVTDGGSGDTSATAPGKSIEFFLYYTGRLSTRGTIANPTYNTNFPGGLPPDPAQDPPWFNWN